MISKTIFNATIKKKTCKSTCVIQYDRYNDMSRKKHNSKITMHYTFFYIQYI